MTSKGSAHGAEMSPYDARLTVTDPPGAALRDVAAAGVVPDELVVGCFFRTPELRKAFLDGLRRTVALAAMPDRAEERARDAALDDSSDTGLLRALVRRRADLGLGYHAYTLKIEVPPFAASCLISFRALEPEDLARHAARARSAVEGQRRRVLDAFGFPDAPEPD